jgi:hypothetical protein
MDWEEDRSRSQCLLLSAEAWSRRLCEQIAGAESRGEGDSLSREKSQTADRKVAVVDEVQQSKSWKRDFAVASFEN